MRKIVHFACLVFFLFPFSLQAHVELINPQGGETFYSGDTILIQWKQLATHDTQNWELYYSPDGGTNWEVISKTIGVSLREYAWVVPDEGSQKGKIKVFMNNLEDTDYEDISPNFIIENTTGIPLTPAQEAVFTSFKIIPNPSRSSARFQFEVKETARVVIRIYTLAGKLADEIPGRLLPPDVYNIDWNATGLKPGNYLCIVRVGNTSKTFRMQLIN